MRKNPLLPYDCGLTLPAEQRYTNQQFRRLSRWFAAKRVDEADGVALIAIMDLLETDAAARFAFHWKGKWRKSQIKAVRDAYADRAGDAIAANHEAMTPEAGLALCQALLDGGWKKGTLPTAIVRSLKAYRDDYGWNLVQIAEASGLTYDQVAWVMRDHDAKRRDVASNAALLGVATPS